MKKSSSHPSMPRENLERIARTLDQPISTFFSMPGGEFRQAETLALVRAFERIQDPQARARCLTFVTAEAERS